MADALAPGISWRSIYSGIASPLTHESVSASRNGWLDVLVDVEQVGRIVSRLDLAEPLVIRPVRSPDPFLSLVHHEVDVSTARRVRVDGVPIVHRPALYQFRVRR